MFHIILHIILTHICVIEIVATNLQLFMNIDNSNLINISCLSDSNIVPFDIIGERDYDVGYRDDRVIRNDQSQLPDGWLKYPYKNFNLRNINEEWNELPIHFTMGNTSIQFQHFNGINFFVYFYNEAYILYNANERICLKNNLIKFESLSKDNGVWNQNKIYNTTIDTAIVAKKWNHMRLEEKCKLNCYYTLIVNEKLSFRIQQSDINFLQFKSNKNNSGYWKIEDQLSKEAFYWKTTDEINDIIPLPFNINAVYSNLCVSIMIRMCDNCEMNLGLYSDDDEIIALKSVRSKSSWTEVQLIVDDVKYDSYRLIVGTNSRNSEGEKFWLISNIKYCDGSGTRVRKSSIHFYKINEYKCISPINKSVFYTKPMPHETFPKDVILLSDHLYEKEWNNIICINYNNENQCYCGEGFTGPFCTLVIKDYEPRIKRIESNKQDICNDEVIVIIIKKANFTSIILVILVVIIGVIVVIVVVFFKSYNTKNRKRHRQLL